MVSTAGEGGRKGFVGSNVILVIREVKGGLSKGIAEEVDKFIHVKKKCFTGQSGKPRKGRIRVGVENSGV